VGIILLFRLLYGLIGQKYAHFKDFLIGIKKQKAFIAQILRIDSKGNFFTTENIDFANGLYVGVFGTDGEQKRMNSEITSGACNSCHGNSTNVI